MSDIPGSLTASSLFSLFKQAVRGGENQDYTKGSIRKSVFLLAIPMILEMIMESIFAVVDIFFVGKLGTEAVATVGLTESVLAIVYSIAWGLSMAATAIVSRRVGEKNNEEATRAGAQAIIISIALSIVIGAAGVYFAGDILHLMGGSSKLVATGVGYTRIIYGSSIVIMLLFLINGIFRGAGNAAIAMHSLWIANICNIILCPTFIYGLGPIPAMGLEGAAIATTVGRGIGVVYQCFHLFKGNGILHFKRRHFLPDFTLMKSLFSIAWTGAMQFIIGSASWIAMARIVAGFGDVAVAGYQVALRVIVFFILPAWGMANAAATLVGQNLGAGQPQRAEDSVWKTAKYNAIFMALVSLFFFFFSGPVIGFLNNDPAIGEIATRALRIVSIGYIFYGIGMVVTNAFNGAGDTKTPTIINLFIFWAFQIPLAYLMAVTWEAGPKGVFFAILIAETTLSIVSIIIFRRGKWKLVKV
ncbi:MAG: MATE family efflux transporter [Gemmatimonadaceae bacterium]|nr:MATE family efflux transporter [Chitinophagaceae bacterium]